jgi:hypothetical protein
MEFIFCVSIGSILGNGSFDLDGFNKVCYYQGRQAPPPSETKYDYYRYEFPPPWPIDEEDGPGINEPTDMNGGV